MRDDSIRSILLDMKVGMKPMPGIVGWAAGCALTLAGGCGSHSPPESGTTGRHKPAIFARMTFDEATTQANAMGKLVLVDTTACWCVPCKKMDQTTWADERVTAWIDEHAIAIQLDADGDKDQCAKLGIANCATPSLMVYKDGVEFDRVAGYQSPEDLLTWLEGVLAGETHLDRLRRCAGNRNAPPGEVDIHARCELAGALLAAGNADEAADEYFWLWNNMLAHDPSLADMRRTSFADDLKKLVNCHDAAMQAMKALRDGIDLTCSDDPADIARIGDWMILNDIMGENDATLRWYDRVKTDTAAMEVIAAHADRIFDLLAERRRWNDAGWIYPDPLGEARSVIQACAAASFPENTPQEERRRLGELMRDQAIEHLSACYAACLAAGREQEASGVADLLVRHNDDAQARLELVKAAYLAHEPREVHLQWLDEQALGRQQAEGWRHRIRRLLDDHRSPETDTPGESTTEG